MCYDTEINRLIELGLCFETTSDGSKSERVVTFSEPLVAEVVLSLGKQRHWDAADILHDILFRSVGVKTTEKNYEFERLVALELARWNDSTVAEFVGLFTDDEVQLPPWTKTATLQFERADLVHSSSTVREDAAYLRDALRDDPQQSERRRCIWLASNHLRPDLVCVNKEQGFVLLGSVQWHAQNQHGEQQVDSEASVTVEHLGQPKPSTLKKLAEIHGEVELLLKDFDQTVAALLPELQKLHELRILFVEPNVSRSSKGEKNVQVDGNTVTVIVDKTNHDRFFTSLTVAALEADSKYTEKAQAKKKGKKGK